MVPLKNIHERSRREEGKQKVSCRKMPFQLFLFILLTLPNTGATTGFRISSKRLSVRPENVLFIDDRAENIAAAYTFGLHTHLFQESSQAIQAIRVLLHDHPLPDRTL
jgi:hypothetical protein